MNSSRLSNIAFWIAISPVLLIAILLIVFSLLSLLVPFMIIIILALMFSILLEIPALILAIISLIKDSGHKTKDIITIIISVILSSISVFAFVILSRIRFL